MKLYALIRPPGKPAKIVCREATEGVGGYWHIGAFAFTGGRPGVVLDTTAPARREVSIEVDHRGSVNSTGFKKDPLCGLSRAEVAEGYVATTAQAIKDAQAALEAAHEEHLAAVKLARKGDNGSP